MNINKALMALALGLALTACKRADEPRPSKERAEPAPEIVRGGMELEMGTIGPYNVIARDYEQLGLRCVVADHRSAAQGNMQCFPLKDLQ